MKHMTGDPFDGFVKKKDYLICVDSDGCAMDTMDIKHVQCFGPYMVTEWGLEAWKDEILYLWNQVNLYTVTRGINRFKALAVVLEKADQVYMPVEGIEGLAAWTKEADELSEASLEKAWKQTGCICLEKALCWSRQVNLGIEALPEASKIPFEGAGEGLACAHCLADVAIVSSANPDAVAKEWRDHGLMEQVDIMLAQNAGSKASCIEKLLTYGYDKDHVMMVGDAPGDLDAARKNGVHFYPILASREKECWKGIEAAIERLAAGTYKGEFQREQIEKFEHNLQIS